MEEPRVTQMYSGGPYRLFATEPFLGGTPYHGGHLHGYAGLFVCSLCQARVVRVLLSEHTWVCRDCESAARREPGTLGALGRRKGTQQI
jgi:hypothetical protein